MPPPAVNNGDQTAMSLAHRFKLAADEESLMPSSGGIGHAFEPYINRSVPESDDPEGPTEMDEGLDEDESVVGIETASSGSTQENESTGNVCGRYVGGAPDSRGVGFAQQSQLGANPLLPSSGAVPTPRAPPQQKKQCPRHPLDVSIGCDTKTIYKKMRENQHNYRPQFTPESPYVKYRRCVFLFFFSVAPCQTIIRKILAPYACPHILFFRMRIFFFPVGIWSIGLQRRVRT